ncbi:MULTISPECIES: pyridoxal phosphate-dependent aminotransferase [Mycolicibacterium]|uniref:Pyridoxal phosphate-dependent aminotransferase n=1 Tax=Mycolicibacterium austroafricanum TaxID=39687 RepID=A0ABT8HBF4_MYCAO|nr:MULTISPECIES: pyridoxal phosphate-dependent aminotransferase [Mycolicibacterium]MDN4518088.1 pyridoxal phosphate-dependent aminotransferase [Mycolicibacterium austroafricanum]PQP47252.1 putative succinyldiaminopimelate transaminase DapC [Mycolicibacterium austroafricanum]QRZ06152.1 pyridoxal phosphate-dependent aminotransferase [Mycolicibacterium austroafricanum]QZT67628.1 pyridoxal phosphate-dependent aminotransferase [Mycolicibacterium austroafricanum]QZY45397.1 pyridoxal phosphate-depend
MTVRRLQPYAVTIFAEMSALAARVGAVNLGQGFPDEDGPPAMLKAAENAIAEGVNQYPPGLGIAPLRQAIADQRRRRYGSEYDPDTEVLVTVGATEAIAAAILGLVEPDSEVLLIEPFYDSYSPVIAMAGCHRRAVPMVRDGRGFAIDVEGLRRAVTPKTRALILNSPHNPTGSVASDDELRAVAELAISADLLVITDEVYEHLVFDGRRHRPLADYPGMAGRTITISSAGKMFNVTGWKIGWACGPSDLIAGVRAAKQYLSYVGGAPFQPAVAHALATEDAWVDALCASFQSRRDRLGSALSDIGFEVHDSFGTYFLCVDPRPLGFTDSAAFCAELPERVGVAAIPMSAFCDPAAGHAEEWKHLVRFAFCKREDTLDEAIRRLRALPRSR